MRSSRSPNTTFPDAARPDATAPSRQVLSTSGGLPVAHAGAILTVDLGAIRENFRRLRARLAEADCAAVVKADAYGLGAAQVAPALAQEGCQTFFVAHVAEGIELRATLGPGPCIYVLHGPPAGTERDCVAHGLTPVLNSSGQLAAWRETASTLGKTLRAGLQVDSGMSRLGLTPAEVARIAADPGAFEGVTVALVMSHLACAEEPDNPANAAQRESFEALRARLPRAPASLANSSGIFLGPDYHYDLARPGAALYGVNPLPGRPNPMRAVVNLAAKVVQTRDLPDGTGIGYGHTYRTSDPLRVATISLGYADGWHRLAEAAAFFGGIRLPFVGRVSMDSIVLDISALPESRLKEGDLVEVINEEQTVDDIGSFAGTIGYEVLTSLGHRFHRRYVGG
jgi:alanine racemase